MKKILLIDNENTKNATNICKYLKSNRKDEIHLLNNKVMLNDQWFLKYFDLVIVTFINNELLSIINKNDIPFIVQIGSRDLHLIQLVKNACGIISKGNLKELILAIQAIEVGGCYISAKYKEQLLLNENHHYSLQLYEDKNETDIPTVLTEMELKVLNQLVNDKTNQEIADCLYLSKRTVEYYLTSCMQKLNVKSRVGLAVKITKYC